MAIQVRRGNEADFDASKMLPGEWAVSLDTKHVRMCFAPGVVLRMATYEGFEADKAQFQAILAECRSIQEVVRRIGNEVSEKASLTIEYSNSAKESAERAKIYADNAEAVTGVHIATKDRAGLVKGGDNYIAEDGTLMLITPTDQTTMPNSYDGRLKIDSIEGGESKQNTTSGKNLLDCSGLTTETKNGGTFTPVYAENGELEYINVNGTFSAQTDYVVNGGMVFGNTNEYTFSTNAQGSDSTAFAFVSTDGQLVQCNDTEKSFVPLGKDNVYTCHIRVRKNQTITNLKFYPMVRLASVTDATYEPYTNGASPNPSYPQEIKKTVVSGIKTYGGENLFDANTFFADVTGGNVKYKQLQLKPNTWYTMSSNIPNLFNNADASYVFLSGGTDTSSITTTNNGVWDGKRRTVLSDANGYVTIGYRMDANISNNLTQYWYRLEETSLITLSQPIELYGIGDVQDILTPQKIGRKFATRRLTGNENGFGVSSTYKGSFYFSCVDIGGKPQTPYLCTHAIHKGNYATNFVYGTCISNEQSYNLWLFEEQKTIAEIREYLANNEVYITYQLAEETTEALPIADQIALNSLSTYDGITYLEFDSEIEPTFKGEYGTSKVGGYTLEGMLAGRNGELYGKTFADRITALETTVVNNI